MIKKILFLILAVVVGVLAYATTKPDVFHVERTASINAPAEKIFPYINDLNNWPAWSPWEKKDPAMKKTVSANAAGVGAFSEWDGNKEVGKGRMEVTESVPPIKVAFKLDFISPFEGHDTAEFTLTPNGESTSVTWSMTGPSPYIGKVMSVIFNCDKMVGGDFEAGLANLKALAEK